MPRMDWAITGSPSHPPAASAGPWIVTGRSASAGKHTASSSVALPAPMTLVFVIYGDATTTTRDRRSDMAAVLGAARLLQRRTG